MDDQMSESGPLDFSRLGPPLAAGRLDALIAAAVRAGDADLQRRRGAVAVVRVVVAWRRPLLALSGLAAAAAITLLLRGSPVAPAAAPNEVSVAEALGIPAAYAERVEGRASSASAGGAQRQ
jgi:hypothetical protein